MHLEDSDSQAQRGGAPALHHSPDAANKEQVGLQRGEEGGKVRGTLGSTLWPQEVAARGGPSRGGGAWDLQPNGGARDRGPCGKVRGSMPRR